MSRNWKRKGTGLVIELESGFFYEMGKDYEFQIIRLVRETGGGVTVLDVGKTDG